MAGVDVVDTVRRIENESVFGEIGDGAVQLRAVGHDDPDRGLRVLEFGQCKLHVVILFRGVCTPTVSAHRACADQPWKTRLERVQRVTACPIVIRVGCAGNIRIRRDASHPDGAVAQSVRAVDS